MDTGYTKATDTLIRYGSGVKSLEKSGDSATVGGHLVVFDDPSGPVRDLEGDYYTSETYFGARKGDGAECLFHHGIPVKAELSHLSGHFFDPLKVEEDDVGLFASTVLNLRNKYEAAVYDLVEQKKLGWSSGAVSHLVQRTDDGWLKTWIIGEGSLTPSPAEPRTSAMPLKSLMQPATKEFFRETRDRLRRALEQRYGTDDAWLVDASPDEVIYEMSGQLYRFGWQDTAEGISFDSRVDWREVEEETDYVPAKLVHDLRSIRKQIAQPSATAGLASSIRTIRQSIKA